MEGVDEELEEVFGMIKDDLKENDVLNIYEKRKEFFYFLLLSPL